MASVESIELPALVQQAFAQLRKLEQPPAHSHADGPPDLPSTPTIRVPGLDRAMVAVGRAALWKGHNRLALWAGGAAAAANPGSLQANIAAGVACARADKIVDALSYLRRAAAHDGSPQRGNWELAKLLLRAARERTTTDGGSALQSELLVALDRKSVV